MSTCIINSKSNYAFILYEEIVKQGVILVFDSNKQFLFSQKIKLSNSIELALPITGGKFFIQSYYDDKKILKEIYIEKHEVTTT